MVPSSGGTIDPLDTRPKHALVFAPSQSGDFFFCRPLLFFTSVIKSGQFQFFFSLLTLQS